MRLSSFKDPMIALLVLAVLIALVAPATGAARSFAQDVTDIAIFVLFLLNGIRVPQGELRRAIVSWRYFIPLMLFVFGAMTAVGWGLSYLAAPVLPPLVVLGFIYLGILPSTVQMATSYTTLAGGTVALAVIGAALLNIVGVIVSPFLLALLGGAGIADAGNDAIVKIALILVLPFAIGQLLQSRLAPWLAAHRNKVVWLDRGIIALAVYVAMSGAAEQDLLEWLDGLAWLALLSLVGLFLLVAHFGAWYAGGLLKLSREDRIAFLFGGAQKSVAVGAPLAAIVFAPEVAGFVIAPLLLYHLLQLVIAAPLANRLSAGSQL